MIGKPIKIIGPRGSKLIGLKGEVMAEAIHPYGERYGKIYQVEVRTPGGFQRVWLSEFSVITGNPFPAKGLGKRRFAGQTYYYAGRTIYPSKARLVASELSSEGVSTKITSSRGAGSLLWTSRPMMLDLSEPIRNPVKLHTEVRVPQLPKCDFCSKQAKYDGKTRMGPWAYMCPTHFRMYGVGLGLGRGQKLIIGNPLGGKPIRNPVIAQTSSRAEAERAWELLKSRNIPVTLIKTGRYWFISSSKPVTAQKVLMQVGIGKRNPLSLATMGTGLATGLGFGAGMVGMKKVIDKVWKNPRSKK